jgi:hypothetical protein
VGAPFTRRIRGWLCCVFTAWFVTVASPLSAAVIIQLRVVQGEGTIYPTGSRATRGLTVQVTDELGKPVEGASVSFQLPDSGPTGVFGTGLPSEVSTTNAEGKASVWGMQWNRASGPFEIKITAVKEQARAGIVSTQYLNDSLAPKAGGQGTFTASHHSRTKWLLISAVGAGALAGVAFSHSSSHAASASAVSVGLQIGNPSIIIGH